MPNQRNFVSNIAELALTNTKYTVSRIIDNPIVNPLFSMEAPSDFLDFMQDYTVEMNVYSLADNSLIYTQTFFNEIGGQQPIQVQQFTYNDSSRTLLFIDFSKIGGVFIPVGKYKVSFNFLVNELGTSSTFRGLRITKISPSRREVEVKFDKPTENTSRLITEFTSPTIKINDALDMIKQVFNQEGSENLNLNMYTSSINRERIEATLGISASNAIVQYNFAENSSKDEINAAYRSNLGLYTIAQQVLDYAYNITSQSLIMATTMYNSRSFSLEELTGSVQYAISRSYDILEADETTNPNKYRFDLI